MTEPLRDHMQTAFAAALTACHGTTAVHDSALLAAIRGTVHVASVGKAAAAMLAGARQRLGDRIARALLVTSPDYLGDAPGAAVLLGEHPIPAAGSLAAGQALWDFVASVPAEAALLLLVSGGASSLVEYPVAGVGLPELQRMNRWLLASGLDIHAINAVRKRVSRIKGGGLLARSGTQRNYCLMISDVADDAPASIGSGLMFAADDVLPDGLPEWLGAMLVTPAAQRRIAAPQAAIVAAPATARAAACAALRPAGLPVVDHATFLGGSVAASRDHIVQTLTTTPGRLHVWSGEPLLALPARPGQGGRCQHLALAVAEAMRRHRDWQLLAGATDGSDGSGRYAGALVDGGTLSRAAGYDAADCLRRADAGRLLAASGDRFRSGVTHTNVTDLFIACAA